MTSGNDKDCLVSMDPDEGRGHHYSCEYPGDRSTKRPVSQLHLQTAASHYQLNTAKVLSFVSNAYISDVTQRLDHDAPGECSAAQH